MSSITWKGPKIVLPEGVYQFRRLGYRDLRELFSIWVQYQTDAAERTKLTLSSVEAGLDETQKEALGRSVYELALSAPDRAFEFIFSTLVPVPGSGPDKTDPPPLTAEDAEDENKIPIWFVTSYVEKLLDHKDFDRFFTELLGLLRKDGKLRSRITNLTGTKKPRGSGRSNGKQDGQTSTS